MIRVLLAEDQAMVRGALAALLKLEPDIEVVASVADGEIAWRQVQALKPDVILTDIEMPQLTGLELAQRVRDAGLECKVVILTTFARPGYLRRALDAGASGYLLKDAPAEKLADSLRKVHRGGRAVDPELAVEAGEEGEARLGVVLDRGVLRGDRGVGEAGGLGSCFCCNGGPKAVLQGRQVDLGEFGDP